jgi:thymidylate kinase
MQSEFEEPMEIFLKVFFEELNDANIRYCVLRNYEQLPNSTGGSDIDMWVHDGDIEQCIAVLTRTSESAKMQLVTFFSDCTAIKVGCQNNIGGVQIDIFKGAIYYKQKVLVSGELIAANTKIYNRIQVLGKEFGDLLALIKELMNNSKIKDKYLIPIYAKKDFYSIEYLKKVLPNFNDSFLHLFCECVKESSVMEKLHQLKNLGQKGLSDKNEKNGFALNMAKVKRLFGKRPGYVIVVEGTDGSGKSFIINSITPILNECFHNGVVYNHLRPNWLPDIAVVLGKRKKPQEGQEVKVVSDPHAGKQSCFMMSLVRWGWYMLDYTLGFLKKVWLPIHSKSKVFIFDRYYYEFYLDQKRSHVKLPNWVVRVGEFFLPKPDLILCLGGDPEKIYARKPETSLEEVQRQTAVLKNFCQKRKNAVWIDTTVKPEESIEAAMLAITAMMGKRFKIDDVR